MTDNIKRAAVIDIGSNSIRCARYAFDGESYSSSPKKLITTRLGEGLIESGALNERAMRDTLDAAATFAKEADECGIRVFAYATSAVRDASNGGEFVKTLAAATGASVDVLSGEREARYAYDGAVGDAGGGLIDIGGGSTQITTQSFCTSAPMGCVRARDLTKGAASLSELRTNIEDALGRMLKLPKLDEDRWTGVGGTITTLAALSLGMESYDPERIKDAVITPDSLEGLIEQLDRMGEKRRHHPLLVKRHDVIICGAAILAYEIRVIGAKEIHAADSDGMEGYFMHIAKSIL